MNHLNTRSRIDVVSSARICSIASMNDWDAIAEWLTGPCDLVICCNEDMNPGTEEFKELTLQRFIAKFVDAEFDPSKIWLRINSLGSGLWRKEILGLYQVGVRQFVMPKVESASDVLMIEKAIEREWNSVDDFYVLVMIETATGLANLNEILNSSARIAGVVFGREDFRSSVGIPLRTNRETQDLVFPSALLVREARRAGLAAIDGASDAGSSIEELRADADFTAAMGFTGKLCVSTEAARSIWEGFSPNEESIALARSFIGEQAAEIVTEPMKKRAELTLALKAWASGDRFLDFM